MAISTNEATAQEQQATPGVLEEIIVTARRRDESLMDTPVSVTAFSEDMLAARQIDSLDQIAQATPGLLWDRNAGHNSHGARVFIRGVGQTDYAPTKQVGVGLYVDGVYVAQNAGSLIDIVDVETIEVLRGPQGTLFGRNTIGGAIQVNSVKPSDEFNADLELLAGRFDHMRVKGRVNIPFSDTFYGRFSGLFQQKDGYINTPNNNNDGRGGDDINAARIALRWTPSDLLTIDLAGDYTNQQSNGAPRVLGSTVFNGYPPRLTNAGQYNFGIAPVLGTPVFDDSHFLGEETYTSLTTTENDVELDITGVNLTVQWDFSDSMSLKSITAFRDIVIDAAGDSDNSPAFVFHGADDHEGEVFSQEFQLSGTAFENRMNWITGFYYYAEELLNLNRVEFPAFHLLSGSKVDNTSIAGFGQFTYDITDKLSLTLGGRYTDEDLDSIADDSHSYLLAWFCPGGPPPVCFPQGPGFAGYAPVPAPPAPGSQRIMPIDEVYSSDQEQFEPYVNFAYNWNDNLMTYISYSEGFKGGGFTQRIPPGRVIESFKPEFAKVYEVGAKWSNDRVGLSGALFFNDYTELQVLTQRLLGGTTENAADAEIKGGEFEALVAVTDQLRVSFGLSYLDGEYKDVDPAVAFSPDNLIPFLTEWQVNASASYEFPIATGDLVARLDYFYNDDYFGEADNLPEHFFEGYSLLNASLTYFHSSEKWQVAIQGRNILDEYYKTNGSQTFLRTGWVQHAVGPPAEWSVRFKYYFN